MATIKFLLVCMLKKSEVFRRFEEAFFFVRSWHLSLSQHFSIWRREIDVYGNKLRHGPSLITCNGMLTISTVWVSRQFFFAFVTIFRMYIAISLFAPVRQKFTVKLNSCGFTIVNPFTIQKKKKNNNNSSQLRSVANGARQFVKKTKKRSLDVFGPHSKL